MIVFAANQLHVLDFKIGKSVILWEFFFYFFRLGNEQGFDILLFEFVHLSLFLLSFLYIILVIFVVCVLVFVSFRFWKNTNAITPGMFVFGKFSMKFLMLRSEQIEIEYQIVTSRLFRNKVAQLNPISWIQYFQVTKKKYFHMIKKQFTKDHNLPENFDFGRYLRKGE